MTVLAFPKPSSRRSGNAEQGQRLAIDALAFIASHEELVRRFLDVTGLEPHQIRTEAERPTFLVGVLDFILANESDVLAFASQMAVPPAQVGILRNALAISVGMAGEDFSTHV